MYRPADLVVSQVQRAYVPCALGGIRTPNLLIRSQMLYPLSYERLDNDEKEYTRGALTGQSAPAARSGRPCSTA